MEASKKYRPKRLEGVKKFNPNRKRDALYDSDWEKYRAKFLAHNPKCYACGKVATVVDHVKAHKGDVGLFEDLKNHLPLCSTHHNTVTGLFDKNWAPEKYLKKLQYLSDCRVKYSISLTIKILPRYRD